MILEKLPEADFKGALNSSGEEIPTQNCNIDTIQLVLLQTQNIFFAHYSIDKLLSEDNNVPRTLFEIRKVAGSTTY